MMKCKSAVFTPEGGIKTVWEDTKDPLKKYEIEIPPATAEGWIDYDNFPKSHKKESK